MKVYYDKQNSLLILALCGFLGNSLSCFGEENITPDFIFDKLDCVITSEEPAEMTVHLNSYDFSDCTRFVFPKTISYNNIEYTVTSIGVPNLSIKDLPVYWYWHNDIEEVVLPSTLRTLPDENPFIPFGYYKEIILEDGCENFIVKDKCLYSADETILYAVPRYWKRDSSDLSNSFVADSKLKRIVKNAFSYCGSDTIDLSGMINGEPMDQLILGNSYRPTVYYPPTLTHFDMSILERGDWDCICTNIYLPSSLNDIRGIGFKDIRAIGYDSHGTSIWKDEVDVVNVMTYPYKEENLIIRDNLFICNERGENLIGFVASRTMPHKSYNHYLFDSFDYDIPEGIKRITDNFFTDLSFDTSKYGKYKDQSKITFPSTLEQIGDFAFYYYTGYGDDTDNENDAFESVRHHFYYEANWSMEYRKSNIYSRTAEGEIVKNCLPDNLVKIGRGCFMRSNLKRLTIPNVKRIPELAFAGCPYLEEITFGEGVEEIELSALFAPVEDPDKKEIVTTKEGCRIVSLSTTPPRLLTTDFTPGESLTNPVYVPEEAIEAYRNEWGKYFTNFLTTGVKSAEADSATVEEMIYTLRGLRIDTPRSELPSGLYISRRGNRTEKILIP